MKKPKISIILAAYNEEKLLPRALKALQKQTVSKDDYEIIVIDNGSTDKTVQVAKSFGATVYSYNKIQGCGAARQYGSSKANGTIIAFTDCDCIVESDWVEKIEKYFYDPSVVSVSGRVLPIEIAFPMNTIFTFYDWFYVMNHIFGKPLVWGSTMAIRTEAYKTVGGIVSELLSSEDWELAFRLQKSFGKWSVKYARDLVVKTSTRKQNEGKTFYRYTVDGIINYTNLAVLGRVKARPTFHVR